MWLKKKTSQEVLLLPHRACTPLLGTTHAREEIKTRGGWYWGSDMEVSSKCGDRRTIGFNTINWDT